MNLPIRSLGALAAGLLLGSALAPVAAQQQSGVDGQVAVRSDGAVYIISGGQRRWVATVPISDDELNAYPEGDPILVGLGPMGAQTANAPPASTTRNQNPAPAASPQTTTGSQTTGSQTSTSPASTSRAPAPPETDPGVSADIPISVEIDGTARFGRGDTFAVEMKTVKDAVCELSIKWPDDKEDNEDSRTADNRGRCRFNVQVPDNMKEGMGRLKGWARVSGKYNRMDVDFEIKK